MDGHGVSQLQRMLATGETLSEIVLRSRRDYSARAQEPAEAYEMYVRICEAISV